MMQQPLKLCGFPLLWVGADIIRPVILEQNHISVADIFPVSQEKSVISVKLLRSEVPLE